MGKSWPSSRPYASRMATTDGDDLLELEVGAIAGGGGCVARAPDGKVVFVRHSLPGERVRARITASTSSYLRADAVEILVASPDRVEPACRHAGPGRCGGCDFQHVAMAAQRRLKGARVTELLAPDRPSGAGRRCRGGRGGARRARVADEGPPRRRPGRTGGLPAAPVPSGRADRRVPRRHERRDGDGRSHGPVARDGGGRDRHGFCGGRGGGVGGTQRASDAASPVGGRRRRGARQGAAGPGAVRMYAGGAGLPRVGGRVLAGPPRRTRNAAGRRTRRGRARCDGASVADLYAGAGLFAVALAHAVGPSGSVRAVEHDRRACADARHNGAGLPQPLCGRGPRNTRAGRRVASAARRSSCSTRPARAPAPPSWMRWPGLAPPLRAVVYVSCDAASFARDLRVLLDEDWS